MGAGLLGPYLGFVGLCPYHDDVEVAELTNCANCRQSIQRAATRETLHETNQNETVNTVCMLDDYVSPVYVEKLRPAPIDNTKSSILKKKIETIITKKSTYSLCVIILRPTNCSTMCPWGLLWVLSIHWDQINFPWAVLWQKRTIWPSSKIYPLWRNLPTGQIGQILPTTYFSDNYI